ncbi:MAG: glycosyltransferase [Bacteroidales bacterium]|nr:glycosyltransferase [Bacteroidales bacterium]
MKILFILEYYYPNIGGVEKLFKDLAENLANQGHDILIITTRFNQQLPKEETINQVKIKRLNLTNRFSFTFFSIFSIFPLVSKYDFIHTTSYNAAFPAWLAAKIYHKKCIITFHEVWGDLWKQLPYLSFIQKKIFYLYEWAILKLKFDHYIAVSEFTKNKLIESGIPSHKVHRIYNGINREDYEVAEIQKPDNFTFSYFGRLGVSKGLDIILPAAKEFISQHPQSVFKCIIPQTPQAFYKKVLSDIEKLDFGENILILHHLSFDDLKKEIRSSNCILIPSYSEGFCFAAVETTALHTPIISSAKGALVETVSGQYIEMDTHSVKAMITSLERAYHGDFDYKKEIGFPLEESIRNYLKFYQSVL